MLDRETKRVRLWIRGRLGKGVEERVGMGTGSRMSGNWGENEWEWE